MNKDDHPTEFPQPPSASRITRHPLFGALKGVAFVPPGVDLTEPADPDWADIADANCNLFVQR